MQSCGGMGKPESHPDILELKLVQYDKSSGGRQSRRDEE